MLASAAVLGWGAWLASFPLGVPGEWEWPRLPAEEPHWLRIALPALLAVGYLAFVVLAAARLDRAAASERRAWLAGLVVAAFSWLFVLQESAPTGYQLSKAAWVLYFPKSSGYFTQARLNAGNMAAYLANYEQKLAQGDVLHLGTHPPGLIVFYSAALEFCRRSPQVVSVLRATETESAAASFDAVAQWSRLPDFGTAEMRPLDASDRAVLWLALLTVQSCAALTVLPLYGLANRSVSAKSAFIAASFWPCVPALAIFIPKSDAAFPLLGACFLHFWLKSLENGSIWRALVAAGLLWFGTFCSLAFAVLAVMAALAAALRLQEAARANSARHVGAASPRGLLLTVAAALALFAVLTIAASLGMRMNLVQAWWLNLRNHADFYEQFSRTWWKWMLVNPLELWVAVGAPLGSLAVWSAVRQLRRSARIPLHAWACGGAWLALYASGKNMGEAARLWLFLMPLVCWLAAPVFEDQFSASPLSPKAAEWPANVRTENRTVPQWAILLAMQLVTTLAVVPRIGGFHF